MHRLARRLLLPLLAASALAGPPAPALARSLDLEALAACDRLAPLPSLDPSRTTVTLDDLMGEDPEPAIAACRRAYELSLRPASLKLQYARVLLVGLRHEAVPLLREVAETGDLEARYGLFRAYLALARKGAGPTVGGRLVSRAEAEAGLRRAAEGGHPEAILDLGRALGGGFGLRRDPEEARLWLERAMGEAGRVGAREGLAYAELIASDPAATPAERERAYAIAQESARDRHPAALLRLAVFLRAGIGVAPDPARARALLEEAVAAPHLAGSAGAPLAEMRLAGEGGPVDVAGAVALVTSRSPFVPVSPEMQALKARLLTEGKVPGLGRDRRGAILALARIASNRTEAIWPLADLLARHPVPLPEERAAEIRFALEERIDMGDERAVMALARLKLAGGSLRDEAGGYALLERAARALDDEALALLASRWGDQAGRGTLQEPDDARAVLERLMARNHPAAFRVHGRLLRAPGLYPQDDAAATRSILRAAELGDVEAMLLAADALESGLGVAADRDEALRWAHAAAKAGSVRGVERVHRFFASSRGEMSPREAVSDLVAVYNEGLLTGSAPGFLGSTLTRLGAAGVARAVLDAFRVAPAGLEEERIVPLLRALPREVRAAMEGELIDAGFLAGAGEGHFGPDARAALQRFVAARGPLGPETAPAVAAPPAGEPRGFADVTLPREAHERMRLHVKGLLDRGGVSKPAWRAAVRELNHLARFGDPLARWFAVKRFDDEPTTREEIASAEVIRYGFDLIATNPPELDEVQRAVLFNVTHVLLQRSDHKAFLDAFFEALREDERVRARLTAVQKPLRMAPMACTLIAREAKARGIPGVGANGCDDAAEAALKAWGAAQGPIGDERRRRLEARAEILRVLAGLPKEAKSPQRVRR